VCGKFCGFVCRVWEPRRHGMVSLESSHDMVEHTKGNTYQSGTSRHFLFTVQ